MSRRDGAASLHDTARRRREELVASSVALEMIAEGVAIADDGSLVVEERGRQYKIEVKAFEIGAIMPKSKPQMITTPAPQFVEPKDELPDDSVEPLGDEDDAGQ